MFTGLVQALGKIVEASPTEAGRRIVVDTSGGGPRLAGWGHRPDRGDSISVSGCCLTVANEPDGDGVLAFDAIPETLSKTTIGERGVGDLVNLEHSVTASTLMGGHFVQGHVDGVARVVSVQTDGEWRVRLEPPAGLMRYVSPKGSVCLEGVSLTIAAVDAGAGWFEVALIPETLERTTLGDWKVGEGVNMEADTIAKTVVHYLEHYGRDSRGGDG